MKDHPKIRRVDFYADEWLAGTVQLTLQEEGLYWRICSLIYSRGEAITYDMLKSACRNDHGLRVRRGLDKLVRLGKVTQNGDRIDSERCQNEIRNASERIQNAIRNGAKGGRPNGLAKPGGLEAGKANYQLSTTNHQIESPDGDSLPPIAPPHEVHANGRGKRGSRIPDDWQPDAADVAFACGEGLDAGAVADEFADYWRARAGAGGVKLDWSATFRNWCRRQSREYAGPNRSGGNGHSDSRILAALSKVRFAGDR